MLICSTIVAAVASLSFTGTGLGRFWTPSELTATGDASTNYFGSSVAIDGDTCVIGAAGPTFTNGGAYVFTKAGDSWSHVELAATATGGGETSGDQFGWSVALEGDSCVIGAVNTNSGIGSAYVFTGTGGSWSQAAELTSGDGDGNFGWSVAIDGDTCVIGSTGTNSGTGSAYVFTRSGGSWSQVAELTAIGGASNDGFGGSVALDGDTCVIGSRGANSGTGSAYVFTRSGGSWSQAAELTATGGAGNDGFGGSVDLDGDTCVIGAPYSNSNTGSAYVFTNTNGTWSQVAELTATGGASGDFFGTSVGVNGDTCVIGAWATNSFTGSAYVFANTFGSWGQVTELTATGGATNGQFGWSVALDGDSCVIGAPAINSLTGSAYVYGPGSSDVDNDGACCYDGLCFSITEAECAAVGGSFTAEACAADTACPTSCSSDSDNDGDVDIEDLLNLLSAFGACP